MFQYFIQTSARNRRLLLELFVKDICKSVED